MFIVRIMTHEYKKDLIITLNWIKSAHKFCKLSDLVQKL